MKKEIKERIKRHAENFKNKYPVKKIGRHHYIRIRDLGYFIEEEKQKWGEEILPKEKEIRKSRTTDEKRYPMGWNAYLEELKQRIKGQSL